MRDGTAGQSFGAPGSCFVGEPSEADPRWELANVAGVTPVHRLNARWNALTSANPAMNAIEDAAIPFRARRIAV